MNIKEQYQKETGEEAVIKFHADYGTDVYVEWLEAKLQKFMHSPAPEVSEIIRRKFHGFSDEQWENLKDTFPYSEIPFIVKEAIGLTK